VARVWPTVSCNERILNPALKGFRSDVSLTPGAACEASNIKPPCKLLMSAIIALVTLNSGCGQDSDSDVVQRYGARECILQQPGIAVGI